MITAETPSDGRNPATDAPTCEMWPEWPTNPVAEPYQTTTGICYAMVTHTHQRDDGVPISCTATLKLHDDGRYTA